MLEKLIAVGGYKSKSELRRLFVQGAVSVNGSKVPDIKEVVFSAGENVLQIGKGKFFKVLTE